MLLSLLLLVDDIYKLWFFDKSKVNLLPIPPVPTVTVPEVERVTSSYAPDAPLIPNTVRAAFPVSATRLVPDESSIFDPANCKDASARSNSTFPAASVRSILFPPDPLLAVNTAAPIL